MFLLVNKPEGITSYDVVDYLREVTNVKKIGHAGTLDPLANGLLILGIGWEATKKLSKFLKMDKEYLAEIQLGVVSDTYDKREKIEEKKINKKEIPSEKEVKNVIKNFLGKIKQTPPIFSAKKVKGRKLYQLARKGEKPKPKPVEVEIYNIEILKYNFNLKSAKNLKQITKQNWQSFLFG